jgi:hypothetical protein
MMKVFEILYGTLPQVSEEDIANRLRNFDWKYEYSDDLTRVASGNKQLELLENMVYQLWKTEPEKAIRLWNANTPVATPDISVAPSFIYRLANQDPDAVLPT